MVIFKGNNVHFKDLLNTYKIKSLPKERCVINKHLGNATLIITIQPIHNGSKNKDGTNRVSSFTSFEVSMDKIEYESDTTDVSDICPENNGKPHEPYYSEAEPEVNIPEIYICDFCGIDLPLPEEPESSDDGSWEGR